MAHYFTCTETELVLNHPLGLLPRGMRRSIERWLREHDINPVLVAPRAPIRRDPSSGTVTWFAQRPDAARVRTVNRSERPDWPSPFPNHIRTDVPGYEPQIDLSS